VNAQIQPQVSGYLVRQNYVEGAVVPNQVLSRSIPGPFKQLWIKPRRRLHRLKRSGKTQLDVQRDTPWPREKQLRRANWTTISS
jgi:membrane fusion protein (multidrug efflux system)